MRIRSVLAGVLTAACGVFAGPAVAAADPALPFIVGGHDATERYPFMASLQGMGQHGCGGSLIAPDLVLTAAHCISPAIDSVLVGTNDLNNGGERAGISDTTVHPSADIALVHLDSQVQAKPIEIAADSGAPGTATRIIGWGQTCAESGCPEPPPTMLQELDTEIVPDGDCQSIAGATEICTSNPNGDSGACYGDSGGPQIKGTPGNWKLIGVTSRAGNNDPTCATAPSIYSDAPALADWINQNS